MKRIFLLFTMLLVSKSVMAYRTWTDPDTGITWTYELLSDNTVSLGGGNSYYPATTELQGDVILPLQIDNTPVTKIGRQAFSACSGLTNITIPHGIISIGDNAFEYCNNLCGISIPESVSSIGEDALKATKLWFDHPDGMIIIDNCLVSCKNRCSGNVEIPNGVRLIAADAFLWCQDMTSVKIPSSVRFIGQSAFANCTGITCITIPEGVKTIEASTFYSCNKLAKIDIPNTVREFCAYAFWGCSVSTIKIPEGTKSINDLAFYGSSLRTVFIPSSVTNIGAYAFKYCKALTSAYIPKSISKIGYEAFFNDWAVNVYVEAGDADRVGQLLEKSYCRYKKVLEVTVDGGVYTNVVDNVEWAFGIVSNGAKVISSSATQNVVIPSSLGWQSVTSIDNLAFNHCTNITSVTIPASVKAIGNSAFEGCDKLADVYFEGDTISSIGHEAFTDCYWDLIMHVPATWQGRGRTICGYTILKGSMFIVK